MGEGNMFANLLLGIMNAAESRIKEENTYMGDDGYRHCKVCGEPIEAPTEEEIRAVFPWKTTRVRMCRCDREEEEAEREQAKKAEARYQIEQMRSEGLYSDLYRECTFDTDDKRLEKVSALARMYADRFDEMAEQNIGLMFWGGVGTGKTYYAACIANALIEKHYPVIMAPVQDLVADMTENYGENRNYVLSLVERVDLLILDDLGVERGTDYMQQHVYDIINTRANANKPLIVTTNLSPSDFDNETVDIKKRTYDRVKGLCQYVLVGGDSRRKEMSKEKNELLKEMWRTMREAGETK